MKQNQVSKCGIIDLGRACGNNCLICYHRFSTNENFGYTNEPFKDWKVIRAEIDALHDENRTRVAITGGEPLMHRDIVTICHYCNEQGMLPQIITAGYPQTARILVNEFDADELAWVLSVHGDPPTHNYIASNRNAWAKLWHTWKLISKNYYYRLNMVLTNWNWNAIKHLMDDYFPVMLFGFEDSNPFVEPTTMPIPYEINFLKWRPFYGWEHPVNETLIKSYLWNSELKDYQNILELLFYSARDWVVDRVNFRYFPKCDISQDMLKDPKLGGFWSTLNYMFDPWEWANKDYNIREAKQVMFDKWEKEFEVKKQCMKCKNHQDCQKFMKKYEI